jgi:MOSC domain-containing protein YiiM
LGRVEHIFICIAHRLPMREVPEAVALADRGLEGCAHGRPGQRQVLLMDAETLELLEVEPGQVKENLTARGLDVNGLGRGDRLRVGAALLEVTGPCEPCDRMNEIRPGLEDQLRGRRGVLCRVVEGGAIRVGDTSERMTAARVAD